MCDCEMPEFFNQETRFARKEHECCECGGKIMRTEQYHVYSGKWAGDFSSYKTCDDCNILRADVSKGMDDCICFEGLSDEIINSESQIFINRFVSICNKRGSKVPDRFLRILTLTSTSNSPTPSE